MEHVDCHMAVAFIFIIIPNHIADAGWYNEKRVLSAEMTNRKYV